MTSSGNDQPASNNTNRIAKAVFAEAERMGINDRRFLEEITSAVIQRIDGVLPGMEHLVPAQTHHPKVSSSQIQSILQEIIAQKTHAADQGQSVPAESISIQDKSLKDRIKMSEHNTTSPSAASSRSSKKALQPAKNTDDTSPAEAVSSLEKPVPSASPKLVLTENASIVLEKRYLKKGSDGKPCESAEELFHRVAHHIAWAELQYGSQSDVELWENTFFNLMTSLEFLPNSPTLMNAGRELGQLSACFVIPIEDSMESIFNAVKYTALIHKSGGGTGFSFSRLRPEKARVGSTGGVASGPVSFMKVFDSATDVIKQGGMRRGANMAILNVDHPDILEFITAKENLSSLTNFNLSVAVTQTFMNAVEQNTDYDLINPHTMESEGKLNARDVFTKIVDMAWRTGDPGVIFIDEINKYNPTPNLGRIESTNPCGEQPLLPFESCNLGSINLSKMLTVIDGQPQINFNKLAETVKLSVRFLDNVIDVNQFPLPQIEQATKAARKIGLGVMGFADMLIMLGIPYNSEKALQTGEEVMRFIAEEAMKQSLQLGKERGTFPALKGSIYDTGNDIQPRNSSRTTIAPTGTLSIIAGCSSGIEPLFALSYFRHILDGEKLVEVHPHFERIAKDGGFYSEELMKQLAEGKSLQDMPNIPDSVKEVFVTAHDITPEWHVRMQAAFQRSTDSAVSKTVNLPHESTREDIASIYKLAHQIGLKGITIYRDRSRDTQVLNLSHVEQKTGEVKTGDIQITPRKRPKVTRGTTERVTTGCGNIYVTVNFDEHGICEVFSSLGKAGGCASAQLEATSRLISLSLRSGISVESIARKLRAIRCPSVAWEEGHAVLSCADAIASVLEKYDKDSDKKVSQELLTAQNTGGQCPECASLLIYQEGCHICPSCGYTKCG